MDSVAETGLMLILKIREWSTEICETITKAKAADIKLLRHHETGDKNIKPDTKLKWHKKRLKHIV